MKKFKSIGRTIEFTSVENAKHYGLARIGKIKIRGISFLVFKLKEYQVKNSSFSIRLPNFFVSFSLQIIEGSPFHSAITLGKNELP